MCELIIPQGGRVYTAMSLDSAVTNAPHVKGCLCLACQMMRQQPPTLNASQYVHDNRLFRFEGWYFDGRTWQVVYRTFDLERNQTLGKVSVNIWNDECEAHPESTEPWFIRANALDDARWMR